MTEHYTKEEAVELARECGFTDDEIYPKYTQALINAAVTRKLAEKELEVVRLRELIDAYVNNPDISTTWGSVAHTLITALSTPSSTKHLDEYVDGKVKPLEVELNQWIANSRENKRIAEQMAEPYKRDIADLTTKLAAAEERVKELEKPEKTCKWTLWADGGLIYDTECGNGWMFEAGDIADNGVKFCPYCGRKIDAAIEAEKGRTE